MTFAQLCKAVWSRVRHGPAAPLAAPIHRLLLAIYNYHQQGRGPTTARLWNRLQAAKLLYNAARLAWRNQHADSLLVLQRCLKLVPGDTRVLLTKLRIEANLQRYDDALDSGLLVLAQNPACKPVRPNLDQLLSLPALASRHDELIRRLSSPPADAAEAASLREAAEDLMPTLVRHADQLIAAGSIAAAAKWLSRCQPLAPESAALRLGLARLRMKEHRFAEALAIGLEVLDGDPANDSAVASLAEMLPLANGTCRLESVGPVLSRHLKAKPDSYPGLTCLMHWVDALVRNGGVSLAANAIEDALAAAPGSDRIRDRILHLLAVPAQAGGNGAGGAATAHLRLGGAHTTFFAPNAAEHDAYDRLVALNVVDTVAGVVRRFYQELDYDTGSAPLVSLLAEAREHLGNSPLEDASRSDWPLLRFEAAWSLYLNGERERSIHLLRSVVDDPALPRFAKDDAFAKEALVRSGEIVGRHDERAGDGDRAMAIYRKTMQIEENSVVARRMALIHWRKGDILSAMDAAEHAVMTKHNLFPRLPAGPYVSWLRDQLANKGNLSRQGRA